MHFKFSVGQIVAYSGSLTETAVDEIRVFGGSDSRFLVVQRSFHEGEFGSARRYLCRSFAANGLISEKLIDLSECELVESEPFHKADKKSIATK